MEAVDRAAMAFAAEAVPVAAVDSTSEADFSVARVFWVAGRQLRHGKGMVVCLEVSVDQVPGRRAILPTSEGAAAVRIGPRLLDRLREVGPARLNPLRQIRRDRHPPSIRIGPRPPDRLREVGPARRNPPGQACRGSPSTRIADCRIPETLDSVILHSAIPRFPIHESGRAFPCSEVHDSPEHITLTRVQIPSIENPRSMEAIFPSSRTYLAWR